MEVVYHVSRHILRIYSDIMIYPLKISPKHRPEKMVHPICLLTSQGHWWFTLQYHGRFWHILDAWFARSSHAMGIQTAWVNLNPILALRKWIDDQGTCGLDIRYCEKIRISISNSITRLIHIGTKRIESKYISSLTYGLILSIYVKVWEDLNMISLWSLQIWVCLYLLCVCRLLF